MRTSICHSLALATALSFTSLAAAQSDDCDTPTDISDGFYTFQNDTFTESNFDGGDVVCFPTGLYQLYKDGFFRFTVPEDGSYRFQLHCIGSFGILQLHSGSDCNAFCVGTTEVANPGLILDLLDLVMGEQILVQVGNLLPTEVLHACLEIRKQAPAAPNASCATPTPIAGEVEFDWDNSGSLVPYSQDMSSANDCLSIRRDLWYEWTCLELGFYRFSTENSPTINDTAIALYTPDGCTGTCIDFDDTIGADNLAGSVLVPFVTEGTRILVQVGSGQTSGAGGIGHLSITRETDPVTDGVFNLCGPGNDHHEGDNVVLEGGIIGGPGSGLRIEARNGPVGATGFLIASTLMTAPTPLGEGNLCLAIPIGRYTRKLANNRSNPALASIGQFDPYGSGQFLNLSGTSTGGSGFDVPTELPPGLGTAIGPGTVLGFQLWYRDEDVNGNPSSNLSDVVAISF